MTASPSPTGVFDPRPLTDPVDRAAVRAHAAARRERGASTGGFRMPQIVGVILGVVFAGFFVWIGATILSAVLSVFFGMGSGALTDVLLVLVGVGIPVLAIAAFVGAVVVIVYRTYFGSAARAYRLDRFAQANGMSFVGEVSAPPLPGMIFSLGRARTADDVLRGERPRWVEFGNYRYTTGSGKNSRTHRWGYVAVKLDTPLPHIVLDAVGNNGLFGSNLPQSFDKEQRLGLEGDFDRYFSLYCPTGYERDALYLFTPDVMARFIDNAAALDVEIVDDWLFLYSHRSFSTLDPATWAWLFSVVGALLEKLDQWARWRDDRLAAERAAGAAGAPAHDSLPFATPLEGLRPPPGVAAPGKRLRRRFSWLSIVAVVGLVLFWLLEVVWNAL